MKNPLLDQEFLRKLDLTRNKATYAKIILLTIDEMPVYEIQGQITAGNINIDNNSAIRRTCSLTMVSKDVDVTNTYWALKNKFKLEVGVENKIDPQYPDIIWFKQGIFVFTSLNMNVASNNFTISLNGKDKMCLLNGEVGGSINASIDFGQLEEYENIYHKIDSSNYKQGTHYEQQGEKYVLSQDTTAQEGKTYYSIEIMRQITKIPIIDIIKNILHVYVGEPLNNIVLNDIDNYGLELLEYRGDTPLFMLRDIDTNEVTNMFFEAEYRGYESKDDDAEEIVFELDDDFAYYNSANSVTDINKNAKVVYAKIDDEVTGETIVKSYNIIRVVENMTVGYRKTDLTYPSDLIANVNESLTSILDKIKNMFAGFEYFYDIDGRFVFQKTKNYINTSFNNIKVSDNETFADAAVHTSATTYSFQDGILLSAFTDAPTILNIKNDFSIWGKREGVSGASLPIHLRYAIDFKPTFYRPIKFNDQGQQIIDTQPFLSQEYIDEESKFTEVQRYDWRELIYQMASDYFNYANTRSDYPELLRAANPNVFSAKGGTGYESYYTDLQGFWRQLYNPEAIGNTNTQYERVGKVGPLEFQQTKHYIKNEEYLLQSAHSTSNLTYYTHYIKIDSLPEKEDDIKNGQYYVLDVDDDKSYVLAKTYNAKENYYLKDVYSPIEILTPADFPTTATNKYYIFDKVSSTYKEVTQYQSGITTYYTKQNYARDSQVNQQNFDAKKHYIQVKVFKKINKKPENTTLYYEKKDNEYAAFTDISIEENYFNVWKALGVNLYTLKITYDEATAYSAEQDYYVLGEYVELEVTAGLSKDAFSNKTGFSINVSQNPEVLNFWFDFLDTDGDLGKYAVQTIGSRPKAINDDKVQAIYFQETPSVLFITSEDQQDLNNSKQDYNNMTGYTFVQITPQLEGCFSISAQGKSAKDELDNLLYNHTYATEQVTLTSVPIYYLQPNTRIIINDQNTGINGEFIVAKITIPLAYNGTSSITATRAVERIY